MQAITLLIAVAASILVLVLRPARAFGVYLAVLFWYPTYLVVQVGPLDISAVRIVVTVLLLRCLLNPEMKRNFKWSRLDSWVTFGAIVGIIMPLFSSSVMKMLEYRCGHLLDTYFAYMAARHCLVNHRSIVTAIKWVALASILIALIGVVECLTGWQSFNILQVYCPWQNVIEPQLNPRSGLYRARGPFTQSIVFGASLAIILPLVYCLRYEAGHWRKSTYLLLFLTTMGVLSSMASGPVTMLMVIALCLTLEYFKYMVKPLLVFIAFSCVAVEIISNRPFYHVIVSYANPLGGSGWHRAKIIDLAIERFGEWWLVGYGGRDPGWGPSLGAIWTDITNHYVVAGVENGLLGIVALCGMLVTSLYMMIRLYRSTQDPALRSWYWALGSAIVTLAIGFNAILFSGQAGTLFFCILGFRCFGNLDSRFIAKHWISLFHSAGIQRTHPSGFVSTGH